ncbi:MAG: MBL fold metallo-hydrolase [Candidatus Kerfeldbacteria bacterium]|nr:MBL fold metallo-hydrolase [Candidatus Kerfeldbacteria bacterium]
MSRRSVAWRIGGVSIVCAAALFFWLGPPVPESGHGLRVIALDVGQGDAILIRTPNGEDVLIDGGPDSRVVERLSANLPASDRTIELVVSTHADLDHVGGLADVAGHYRIDRVLETGVRSGSGADRRWVEAMKQQKTEVTTVRAGTTFVIDGTRFDVLWPQTEADLEVKKRNNTSVVLELTYGSTSFLFTGDIESEVEERLVASGTLPDVDVLKVPHHGSISSSSQEFIEAVKPEYAVISVGKNNKFGHPHPVVVRRLEQRGVKIWRTDEDGDVVISSDGKSITFDN